MPPMLVWPRRAALPVIILGVLLLMLRRPEGVWQSTIWAEDGRVFWAAALQPGVDLSTTYAAQLWMAQRLAAQAVVIAPPDWAPPMLYGAACLIAVLAIATVLQRRARVLFGQFRYQLLAFLLVLMLPTAWEVQGNLTNIQLWLGVGMLIVLVLPAPVSVVGRVSELAFVLLAGLTGFLGVLLSPVAAWALVARRGRYVSARSALVMVAAACNIYVWLGAGRAAQEGSFTRLARLPETLLFRWGGGALLGEFPLRDYAGGRRYVLLLAAVFLCLVLAAVWRDRRGPSVVWLLPALLWGVLAILSPTGAVGDSWMFDPSAHWRYFALGVASCVLVLVRAVGTSAVRWPFWLALAACAPALLVGARLPAMGPALPPDELRSFARCLEVPGAVCELAIAPEGWVVVVVNPQDHSALVTQS
ncbi:MAG: hypothetical protein KDC08_06290 [Actinobacteria bacterium]|nr:hypothetical protein [Actinomycetota bacterium]